MINVRKKMRLFSALRVGLVETRLRCRAWAIGFASEIQITCWAYVRALCMLLKRSRSYVLANTFLTDDAYHCPPRAVVIPLAFKASAIWRSDVAPARRISRMTGSTLAACWSASALITRRALARSRELRVT